jgi:hypothetical protein
MTGIRNIFRLPLLLARPAVMFLFFWLAGAGWAGAHPESISNLRLVLRPNRLSATMTLPVRDLTRWFPPGTHPNYISDVVRELRQQMPSILDVAWDDALAQPISSEVVPGKTGFIIAKLEYAMPEGASTLLVRSESLGNLPSDHQQVASVEDERGGVAASRVLVEELLNVQQDTLTLDLPDAPAAAPQTAASPQMNAGPGNANVALAAAVAPAQPASSQTGQSEGSERTRWGIFNTHVASVMLLVVAVVTAMVSGYVLVKRVASD